MEVPFAKVYAISNDLKKIQKLYNYGRKLHDIGSCHLEICIVYKYLNRIEEEILQKHLAGEDCRLKFICISAEYVSIFCTIDQSQKRLGNSIYEMESEAVIKEIDFEFIKISEFTRALLKICAAEEEIKQIANALL